MRRNVRWPTRGIGLAPVLALLLPCAAAAQTGGARVDSLLRAMTLEEKVTFLRGERDPAGLGQAGYVPGVPRLGIPPLRLTDGPAGIRTDLPATAFPAPVALAASFDPELARRYGAAIGRDGLARNQDVLLAPMVNIVRVPQAGRNFETLGEDPHLAARMVAEEVRGIQDAGLIATVKHYVANNFENARTSVSADIGEQALHEIYLPGFEAAVRAGAGSVMCSYNQVNDAFSCDNPEILNSVLRDAWGFEGWVMTDWFARHSAGALEAGLDQEMPGGSGSPREPVWFGDSLVASVRAGRTPEARVDRAVRRILVQMDRFGLLDGAPKRPPLDSVGGAAVARDALLEGAVLLRNQNELLPIDPSELGSVVLVGPTARLHLVGGGGSSHVRPLSADAALPALGRRARAGTEIRYRTGIDLEGVPVPSSALGHEGEGATAPGLLRSRDGAEDGSDAVLDLTGPHALPRGHRWHWSGTLTAPTTGAYDLIIQASSGARGRVTLDGERAAMRTRLIPTSDGRANTSLTLNLEAGVRHALEIDAEDGRAVREGEEGLEIRLAWVTPERRRAVLDSAVTAARDARTAVVFAYNEGTEGVDRASLSLPGGQDDLVEAIARVNPRTVVVLQTGDPVLMPWIDDVGAVLQTWYPGEAGGEATAALLVGEATPAGKLPVTFPRSERDAPTADSARYPGVDGHAAYSEGILVGYRWYDARGVEPLFPFGHGLSYTTFAYEDLRVRPGGDGLDVSFTVRNTGTRAGVEVAQVYLGPVPDPPAPMAVKSLAGFARVGLAPGEAREVRVHLDGRALSYWSEAEHRWRRAQGSRALLVGSSSRDVRLTGRVDVGSEASGGRR